MTPTVGDWLLFFAHVASQMVAALFFMELGEAAGLPGWLNWSMALAVLFMWPKPPPKGGP